ncbi:MAG: cadherin domain-containing protein [Anaerolineae bacterium]|nr:cadherin domain-containing protein [Anaerolineae bacterium]
MKRQATYLSIASVVAAFLLALIATTPARAAAPIVTPNQTFSIAENSPNGSSPTPSVFNAFDPEGKALIYDIIGGDGAPAFDINSATGVITVEDSSLLDYEVKHSFQLTVRVTDDEPQSTQATVTVNLIDASDQAPVMGDQNFSVAENSPAGTTVGTLVYTDGDTNDSHTFDITGGSGDGLFNIDSLGKITVAPGAQLNYEAVTSYNMTVEIEDEGGLTDTALVTVNVTNLNENPVVTPATFTLAEDAANGAVVGVVQANDPENSALTFSLSGTTIFAINANSGQLTVANSALLDFETNPSISFSVQALDEGGKTGSATITVNLTAVNDPPKTTGIPDQIVNEGSAPRVINLWQYFSDDEDPDAALTFTVQNNSNNSLVTAEINNTTGTLTLTFAASGAGTANITVRAFDSQDAHTDDTFVVDINDAPTGPATENVTVNEDAPTSQINLYDVFDDAESADADLTYAIVSVSNLALFDPDPTITKPNLTLDYAADANGKSDVKVRATDGGGLWVETTFKVTVNAVNDPPTTSGIANVNVSEDAPNTVVNLGNAFADKEDADNELDYSVTNNTNANLFQSVTVDDATMTLTLDYKADASGTATLTVQAKDTGNATVETSFQVTVGAANDAPTLTDITLATAEDTTLNFTANTFTSHYTDADGDPLVKVRIDSLPTDGTLRLNGTPITSGAEIPAGELGNLAFVPAPNWNEGSTAFEWNASDGSNYAVASAQVTITIQSQNDKPTVNDFQKTGDEGVNILFAAADFIGAFNDVDGDTLQRIQITQLPSNGALRLNSADVAINQQINVGELGQLRFVPDADWSGTTALKWKGYDGQVYSDPATVTLVVNPTNDPPNLDLNGNNPGTGFSATFVAGGPKVSVAGAGLAITDIDDETMASAKVIIVNIKNGAKEVLTADPTGTDIQVSYSAGTGTLFLSGTDTIANYEKVLRTVKYGIEADVANPDPTERNIQFNVYDGEQNSNDANATVTIVNPRIEVTVTPPIQTVIKGTTAVFTVVIKNTGDVTLSNIQVTSANVPDCNRTFASLAAGASLPAYACVVTNVNQRIDNKVVVKAVAAQTGTQVQTDDEAVVRVLRDIVIDIAPDPTVGSTVLKGQNAVFNVTVVNPSEGTLKDVTVKAYVDYDLVQVNEAGEQPAANVPAPACDATIGTLNAGQEKTYSCTIPNVQASFAIEVVASGLIEGIGQTEDFNITEIGVIDMTLEVFSDPFQVLAAQPTRVEFSMTITNVSNVPLALNSLQSSAHGNLLNTSNGQVSANTCPGQNLAIPPGEVRSCSYEVVLILQPPAFTNVITAVAADDEGRELTVTDEAIVSVADFTPLQVVLSANPASLVAPGGEVNLTAQVTNNMSTDLTLDALNDSIVGNVDGKGTCDLPRTIVGNGTYTCTYPATIANKRPGDIVTHTITAIADSEQDSDSVAINITGQPATRLMLPSVANRPVPGEPNNGACNALPLQTNLSYYYLPDDANDWYRFTLESPARLKAVLRDFSAEGQFILYSGNCASPTYIQHNGDTGVVTTRIVDLGLRPAGTYFIWIISENRLSSTLPYQLSVEAQSP